MNGLYFYNNLSLHAVLLLEELDSANLGDGLWPAFGYLLSEVLVESRIVLVSPQALFFVELVLLSFPLSQLEQIVKYV